MRLDWRLRGTYGITLAAYEDILDRQGGKCAICDKAPAERRLVIDHDHRTGAIRGLLCASCNVGVGMFRDHVGLLRKAIDYLSKPANSQATETDAQLGPASVRRLA